MTLNEYSTVDCRLLVRGRQIYTELDKVIGLGGQTSTSIRGTFTDSNDKRP